MDIGRALSWTAERYPDRPAVGGERAFTWREWDARTNRIARALGALGAAKGERVCLCMSNGEAMAATHLANQKLGVLSTPLNSRYAPEELAYCLQDADPTVVVSDDATAGLLREALERLDPDRRRFALVHDGDDRPDGALGLEEALAEHGDGAIDVDLGPDDPSVMLYTAGTTGRPKGVPRTQRNEHAAAEAHVMQARYGPWESTLGAMPMYHTMGLRSLLSMVIVGGKFVAMPAFKAAPALELIARERVTALYLVPTAFWALVQEGGLAEAGAHVRRLAYAGAAMTPTLCRQLQEALEPDVFVNHYGSTEIYTFCVEEDAASHPGSAGRPGLHSRIRLVRADATEPSGPEELAAPGETGEIIASLRSPEAFQGYWHRPEADERALRGGWYFTGDLGQVDDEGRLHVSGRVDDMIITGGENVHPLEVEDALAACPDVREVAVAGVHEEKWGHAVTAFVVADAGEPEATARRIADWVRHESGLTPYKRPKRIVVLDEIPKSPVGKILRRKLVAGEYSPLGDADTGAHREGAGA
ncbi:MAG: 2-furoate---CoA ligase [Solirubrobacteraceae bacterium]|jgi:2-furoate---CoA ligase|nr:2-furoate---CoA ligase [Solirubrobacteraceae bacterium]